MIVWFVFNKSTSSFCRLNVFHSSGFNRKSWWRSGGKVVYDQQKTQIHSASVHDWQVSVFQSCTKSCSRCLRRSSHFRLGGQRSEWHRFYHRICSSLTQFEYVIYLKQWNCAKQYWTCAELWLVQTHRCFLPLSTATMTTEDTESFPEATAHSTPTKVTTSVNHRV